jgi:hypothetical protein
MKVKRDVNVDFNKDTLAIMARKIADLRAIYGDDAVFWHGHEWGSSISYEGDATPEEIEAAKQEKANRDILEALEGAADRMRAVLASGEIIRQARLPKIEAAIRLFEDARKATGRPL